MQILKNSYVIFIISFILFCIIVYFFEIGQNIYINLDGKQVKVSSNFNWKYPLAGALVLWATWHFYLYPPANEIALQIPDIVQERQLYGGIQQRFDDGQRINMANWN